MTTEDRAADHRPIPAPHQGPATTDDDSCGLPRHTGPRFRRRILRIEPGDSRPYLESEWRDCLVVIESGEVDLEAVGGVRHTCRRGDVLWLAGLDLRCLSNRGEQAVVITTVCRR
ncbi:MAG TPA: hypothetical protein VIU11_11495 [Nakamurella sp.]